ncbi:MAG TPA: acyltransferase family protein, partial [Cellulomonadaceae bacterium]|nr:acyltransferase family protein [Cellulomonadaceae bacterium]
MGSPLPLASAPDAGLGRRDRVLDAVRAVALVVVVAGHSLEWDTSTGSPTAVLEQRPGLVWVTWVAQVLPLFFAAGAVTNAISWRRDPDVAAYLRRRLVRLSTPGLVYAALWTVLLVPLTPLSPLAGFAGRFLAELMWFLAVYAAATLAVPWTIRWTRRPWLTVGLWLAGIVAVDLVRWNVWAPLGWLNLVLVWGFVHQVGYHLPALRQARRAWLVGGGVASVATAVGLGVLGPYSSSMVSFGGDPEPSNLAPPTL